MCYTEKTSLNIGLMYTIYTNMISTLLPYHNICNTNFEGKVDVATDEVYDHSSESFSEDLCSMSEEGMYSMRPISPDRGLLIGCKIISLMSSLIC